MTGYRDETNWLNGQISTHISSSSYMQLIAESFILCLLIYAATSRPFRRKKRQRMSEEQKDKIVAEWKPIPLVPETSNDHPDVQMHFFESKVCKFVTIDGGRYFNLVATNFLGLLGDPRIEKAAKEAIAKYGVGSCGPRGFYGTVDVHLALEKQIAEFLGCEEAVLYSYGYATISSAIPSYAKKGDVIFVDKGVNYAIQEGLLASKSRIEWFEHNDVSDFERLLLKQAELDQVNPKLALTTRRFLVVEGLYMRSGDICPLPELMTLKWKYKVRIFIDESLSFGTIGKTGRGVTEYYGIDVFDVDMIVGSLEHSLASTGGFCAGRTFVVNHQRLSGLGYCFSASLPPLLAAAASKGLTIIGDEPDRLRRLYNNSKYMHDGLRSLVGKSGKFVIKGVPQSPIQHICCKENEQVLNTLVKQMRERSFLLTKARYLPSEMFTPQSSVKVIVQSEMTTEEMDAFLDVLKEIISQFNWV